MWGWGGEGVGGGGGWGLKGGGVGSYSREATVPQGPVSSNSPPGDAKSLESTLETGVMMAGG